MIFNSVEFILFLLVFFSLWPWLKTNRQTRWIYLTAASFFFYGWWDWRFLFLLIGTGLIDYWAALGIERFSRYRSWWLWISMAGNLGVLAFFKYSGFFIQNLNAFGLFPGGDAFFQNLNIILPVGISFYTFQSMSYTIDVYRGELKPTRNVFHFFAYLSLFPQLVAGPIVRAADLLPQMVEDRSPTEKQRWDGLKLIAYGFFKKVVIADRLAGAVQAAFASSNPLESSAYWWVILSMFAVQIYCDFSGYSDIARGLAKWMGYEFMVNFDHPYISASFREFWTRWHISLSTWFRDYVYIPLGGSKKNSAIRSQVNLWITMLASGFWHGADWRFLAWGGAHAAALSLERLTQWPRRLCSIPGGRFLAMVMVFLLVLLTWVFFRANNLAQALEILKIMLNPAHWDWRLAKSYFQQLDLLILFCVALRQLFFFFGLDKRTWLFPGKAFLGRLVVATALVLAVFLRAKTSPFIYFQF